MEKRGLPFGPGSGKGFSWARVLRMQITRGQSESAGSVGRTRTKVPYTEASATFILEPNGSIT